MVKTINKHKFKFKFNFNKTNKKHKNNNKLVDVIIIGAGAAGLSAAKYLQQNNKNVIVLEARKRIGGRIYDVNIKGFGKIPLGAAWLHYKQNVWKNYHNKNHVLKDLLDQLNIKYIKSDGLNNNEHLKLYDHKGFLYQDKKILNLLNDFPKVICNYCKKHPNTILSDSIKKILKQYNLPEDIINAFINRTTEHSSLNADLMKCKNYDCWKPNGDIVIDGYGKLIKKLAKNINIQLKSEVKKIQQFNKYVKVKTKNKLYTSKYLIITVPLGVLKKGSIKFTPKLPIEKIKSLKHIYTGTHEKLFLRFPYCFWEKNTHVFHYSDKENRGLCTQWQNLQFNNKHILYTNISGPDIKFTSKSNKELKNICMKNLRKIFGNDIPEPINFYMTNWKKDPFTLGAAHSQPNLNGTKKDFKIIRKPFHRIHFAGVSTSENISETVEAAILTGIRACKEIYES